MMLHMKNYSKMSTPKETKNVL